MGGLGVNDFMKLFTSLDPTDALKANRILAAGLDRIMEQDSGILGKLNKGPVLDRPILEWAEQISYPQWVTATLATTTLTFSGTLFGAAIDEEALKNVIRVGTVLERPSDGVQVKVTSITSIGSPTFAVTVAAHGNSSLSDDADGAISWRIISELWGDFDDAAQPRSIDRVSRQVGTQIFAETFEIPKSRANTNMPLVADETTHQIKELLEKLKRHLQSAVVLMRPVYDSGFVYGNKTEKPAMCGLHTWPVITQTESANTSVYVNKSGEQIFKEDLDALAKNMWLTEYSDFNTGDWYIICHPNTYQYIADMDIGYRRMTQDAKGVGFSVMDFHSKIGKTFPILADPYVRSGVLQIVDFSKCFYGYYKNDTLDRKELATQGRYQRWLISYQTWGVQVRKPRQSIGTIYGLPA